MFKIVVLLSVAAFSYALSPPKLSETFQANCTAELHHAGRTDFGRALLMRHPASNRGLEVEVYNITDVDVFADYRLERVDLKEPTEYYYRGIYGKTGACSRTFLPSGYKLASFWDWLDEAKSLPNDYVPDEHKYLNYWTREVGGVRFMLGVDKETSRPRMFSRISDIMDLILVCEDYTEDPKKFPMDDFGIPDDCDQTGIPRNILKMFEEIRRRP